MAEELLYTSAPQGLRPGSVGFCTVQASAGMPAPMLQGLESLSAYRHPQTPGDPKNPVSWSHVRLNIGGKVLAVVSRVADAGFDFTQRSNKLAHHVVLSPSERPAGGPAWLLAQDGFLEDHWDGSVKERTRLRDVPQGDQAPGICRTWKRVTGDAGWAGVLAEAFLANPTHQACVRFDLGMPVLELLQEAIALLPVERRWEVTFSTYATTLPQAATCHWRCLLNGSKEANEARRLARTLQWNLSAMGPLTQTSPLIEAARTGIMPEEEIVFASVPQPKPTRRRAADHPVDNQADDEFGADATYDFATEVAAPPGLPPRPHAPLLRGSSPSNTEQKPALLPWIAGGLMGLAVLCVLVIFVVTRPPALKPAEETIAANPNGDSGTPGSTTDVNASLANGTTKQGPVQIGSPSSDPLLAANTAPAVPPITGDASMPPKDGSNPPSQPTTPTVPEPPPVKPPPPSVLQVVYVDSPYLEDSATAEKPITIPLPDGLREAAKTTPVTLQLFVPGKLTEDASLSESAFLPVETTLAVSWKFGGFSKPVAETAKWAVLQDVEPLSIRFNWLRKSYTAQEFLRWCAIRLKSGNNVVIIRPKPFPEIVNAKANLSLKLFHAELPNISDAASLNDQRIVFAVKDAELDSDTPIRFTRISADGVVADDVAPLKNCRLSGKLTDKGVVQVQFASDPSLEGIEKQLKELDQLWTYARSNESYKVAFSFFMSDELEKAELAVLGKRLATHEIKVTQVVPDKKDERRKNDAIAAIKAIRKDFVETFQELSTVQKAIQKLEKAKLKRFSFGYHIKVEEVSEPIYVELVRVGEEQKNSPVPAGDGGTKNP